MKQLLFFLFTLGSLTLSGQKTISGKVVDLNDFAELIGVVITANSIDSINEGASYYAYRKTYVYGVYSDIYGNFSIEVPDSAETLNFLYDGWKIIDLKIPPAKNGQVHLGIIPLERHRNYPVKMPKNKIRVVGKVMDLNGNALSNVSLLFQGNKETVIPWPDGSFSSKIYEGSKKVYIYYNDVWTCRTISMEEKDKLLFKLDGKGTSYELERDTNGIRDKIKCY